jgi:hypothetical protein
MLLDRHREIRSVLDRRVVGDDDAFTTAHPAHSADQACSRGFIAIHTVGGQRRQLEERAPSIEQRVHPVAWQQLPPSQVSLLGAPRARRRSLQALTKLVYQCRQGCFIALEQLATSVDRG